MDPTDNKLFLNRCSQFCSDLLFRMFVQNVCSELLFRILVVGNSVLVRCWRLGSCEVLVPMDPTGRKSF